MRVLVVEDEAKVARALREGLEREKYEVVVAPTGEEGFFLVNAEEFDLVLLDLMLPGRDGLQVLSTLRKRGLQTPVLILTARDAIEDRVDGLDKGADDYLVKPFPPRGSRFRWNREAVHGCGGNSHSGYGRHSLSVFSEGRCFRFRKWSGDCAVPLWWGRREIPLADREAVS